jgi:hypothetical protein
MVDSGAVSTFDVLIELLQSTCLHKTASTLEQLFFRLTL